MEDQERVSESPVTPDKVPGLTEQSPDVQPEAAKEPAPEHQETKRKRIAPRPRKQILTIQKRKKKKTATDSREKKKGRFEVMEKNDIRYRGPLSYRHMMILGWLCLVLSQVSLVLSTAGKLDPGVAEDAAGLIQLGTFASPLFMPLLLLANFSRILSPKQEYKTLLLKFGGLSVAMGLAMPVIYEHYITGLADAAGRLNPELGERFLPFIQNEILPNGYIAYNIFIDLFLCTLFLFFLTYHFKRPIKRRWVIGFRLLSILPVAYELASIVLKALCKNGNITLPLYASPFLTTKPPMMFAAFIALALFIKRRERIFLKNGRAYEEYGHFLETNANSLHFSIHACVTFIVCAIIDLVISFFFIVAMTTGDVLATGEMAEQLLENQEALSQIANRTVSVAQAAGFGESLILFIVAPLVLLYSYTRKHKSDVMDMAIPMAGVAAVAALYVEAFFQAACQAPDILNMYMRSTLGFDFTQLDISELEELLKMLMME